MTEQEEKLRKALHELKEAARDVTESEYHSGVYLVGKAKINALYSAIKKAEKALSNEQ